jgi:hypothetical protein
MHKIQSFAAVILAALLPLSAAADDHSHIDKQAKGDAQTQQEHQQGAKGESMMDRGRIMMSMHQKMAAEMKAADAELDRLLAEMNGSTGDKKIEAMSALLNRLVQQRKAMYQKMEDMMMHHMMEMSGKGTSNSTGAPAHQHDGEKGQQHKH